MIGSHFTQNINPSNFDVVPISDKVYTITSLKNITGHYTADVIAKKKNE